ncbi:enoyl-CoA hydratase/isomerase family protein [Laribacter hongkongensis]|uniref:enoyl-CoA hydratase/isomerase family protein n=1 Tax=Laribacter hongkongensis TaxID=168471 RepID=UPI001EFCB297|nr:enoyl-CoA hydratase/isomerase family protein [Laribacter hongkongensis]MCG9107871.1 enoyl-CoA hydratase/isomerase family protein [Laribacter hongkongensis]
MNPVPSVIFSEQVTPGGQRIATALLNSERTLNALTLDMIRLLAERLTRWQHDPDIALIVLAGSGDKAFCAGGDIRALRRQLVEEPKPCPHPFATVYFTEEYALDYLIHACTKPVLVWGDGIVMGGGLGLLAGASHRVVTETTRMAMPEINIGLYPDVGGSWFLNRMPGRIGLFLGLTGAPLNAADCRYVDLADYAIAREHQLAIMAQLAATRWSEQPADNHVRLSELLAGFAARSVDIMPAGRLQAHFDRIQELTDAATLPALAARFATARDDVDVWLREAVRGFAAGCPATAALTWEIRHRARHLSLAEVFRMELVLSVRCCSMGNFTEGVRARMVDKDNAPRWQPATLEDIRPDWLEQHFTSPWAESPLAHLGESA